MKKFQKLTALLLAIVLSVTAFYGCTEGSSTPSDTTPAETTLPTVTVTESAEGDETTNVPDIPEEQYSINKDNIGDYTIIRATNASDALVSQIVSFKAYVSDIVGEIGIASAWERPSMIPESAFEIVIGDTNRPATESIKSELKTGEYAIVYENGRIYIIGSDDEATFEGLKYFKEN